MYIYTCHCVYIHLESKHHTISQIIFYIISCINRKINIPMKVI